MPAFEQPGCEFPAAMEREDLVLNPPARASWGRSSIEAAAAHAAETAHLTLGVERQWAHELFGGQLEAMRLTEAPEASVPIPSVAVGIPDRQGCVWTPSRVIAGHDRLDTRRGRPMHPTHAWREMFVKRSADWWNKRRPHGESALAEEPLQIVLADKTRRGAGRTWEEQQEELAVLVGGRRAGAVALEAMVPLEYVMLDADAIINGTERPDVHRSEAAASQPAAPNGQASSLKLTRFVQHERDRSDIGHGADGPAAYVDLGRVLLDGFAGLADLNYRYRVVLGLRK